MYRYALLIVKSQTHGGQQYQFQKSWPKMMGKLQLAWEEIPSFAMGKGAKSTKRHKNDRIDKSEYLINILY